MSEPSEANKRASLAAKMAAVSVEVGYIQKSQFNKAQGYAYAGARDVFSQVRDACVKQAIWPISSFDINSVQQVEGRNGKRIQVIVSADFEYVDLETGYSYMTHAIGEGMDSGDKATYKAITGAIRHHLLGQFLIPTGDDPEADERLDEELAAESVDGYVIDFGKHRGKKLEDVVSLDPGWVKWASENAREDRSVFQAALTK